MRLLNNFFELLTFPFLFVMRFSLVAAKNMRTHLSKLFLIFLFTITSSSLYAVELANEQFTSNIDGWTVENTNVYWTSDHDGSMRHGKNDYAKRTYNFGPNYIDQTLDIEMHWCATSEWENGEDYLRIKVNGTTVEEDYDGGGCQTITFTADADGSGDFEIQIDPRTSADNELAYIDWFTVNGTPLSANQAPTTIATVSPTSGAVGTNFSFDGTSSTDDGGVNNLTYTWKEDTTTLGSGDTFSKSDFTAGTHTITLTVTDAGTPNLSNSVDVFITVAATANQAPVAVATVSPTSGTVGTNFTFDGTSSTDDGGAGNLTYVWKEGAVSLGSGNTFSKSDFSEGPHTITLTVTDAGTPNLSNSVDVSITVTIIHEGDRDFTLRHQDAFMGNMLTIGNTILVAPEDQTQICSSYTNGDYIKDATDTNDKYNLCAYHYDTDVNFPTTIAQFPLPVKSDLKIKWAGLYWQALVDNGYDVSTMQIKIKHSDESDYTSIGYDQTDWGDGVGASGYISYSAFKDITYLAEQWGDGNITVGDIPVVEGIGFGGLGTYGAWSLVVIYEDPHEKARLFSIYDGWKMVDKDHGEVDVHIEGFITPKQTPISSYTSVFAAEGDKHIEGDYLKVKPSKKSSWTDLSHTSNQTFNSGIYVEPSFSRTPDPTNNQGIDIQSFELGTDGYNIMETLESEIDFKFGSTQDRYWPSMISFSIELYTPDLCYDYAYQQNGRYFTEENDGSQDPRITGSLFSDSPIMVSLFVKNRELSDFTITNMETSILNIDTTQATYINGTTAVTPPGSTMRTPRSPQTSGPSFINKLLIGDLGGEEHFYMYYNLDPTGYEIDMPLNAELDYDATFTLPNGTIVNLPPYNQSINSEIPLCVDGDFDYAPIYATFNVEKKDSSYYNLDTQVARRVDNFEVTAYDDTDESTIHTPIDISTVVAVELVDMGSYHESQTSCNEPDSILTPKVWVTFDNNVSRTDFTSITLQGAIDGGLVSDQILNQSEQIDEPEDYYRKARRNTAFRVSYTSVGTGSLLQMEAVSCTPHGTDTDCYNVIGFPDLVQTDLGGGNGQGKCFGDMGNLNTIASHCNNAGGSNASSMTKVELVKCMECIYGYDLHYVCSRDNFAIRPEAFKVSLTDDNTSTIVTDFANNTDKAGISGSPTNLVAGYPYRFDINATSYTSESGVEGYIQSFDSSDPNKRAYMEWNGPTSTPNPCNTPVDRNMSFYLVNGTNTNANPINTWGDKHDTLDNVGEYEFKIDDEEWTKFDWDENLTQHHSRTGFDGTAYADCAENSTIVLAVGGGIVGCKISSVHGTGYKAVSIRSYPYTFDTSGISPNIGPYTRTSGQTFIYIDTPPTMDVNESDMSYNMNGTFAAVGYDNGRLSNFVTGCYADDVNMDLNFTYNHTLDAGDPEPYLSHSIKDTNSTNEIITPTSVPGASADGYYKDTHDSFSTAFSIARHKDFFVKDMNGSITMNLGYNFIRTYNTTLNPRDITFHDFNISYDTQPTPLYVNGVNDYQIFGNIDLDHNVTFVYGRAKSSEYFYDNVTSNSINTPISTVVYCDLGPITCRTRDVNTTTDEYDWYLLTPHNKANGDGNVTLVAIPSPPAAVTPASVDLTGGVDGSVAVSYAGTPALPLNVNINFVTTGATPTNRWMIYNEDNDSVPVPFYKVRFIGTGSWTGKGKTGHVVGDDINRKKTRRLGW